MSVHELKLQGWPGNVHIFYTTREGGYSDDPYRGFNLGLHVGDCERAVEANRAALVAQLPPATRIAWLNQVHGTVIVSADDSLDTAARADGCWTRQPGVACAVMVADCLPVLLSDRSGSVVAAVHAGWRGLAAGVLESAVSALDSKPQDLYAWLGPAIAKEEFEIGPEVRSVFLAQDASDQLQQCFSPSVSRPDHYFADLAALARYRLKRMGLTHIQAFHGATLSDPKRFFSYRRDGVTGRMACLILRSS